MDSVLDRADEQLIDNTVRRIPAEAVVPLVNTLQRYVKVGWSFSFIQWFAAFISPKLGQTYDVHTRY